MKGILLSILFALLLQFAEAQVVMFEGTLQEALDKAKKENKYVMVMGSATWCGPCKALYKIMTTEKEAGDYFNEFFVIRKYYLDKDKSDNIEERYGISAYPTMVILNTDGVEINRILGSSRNAKEFIEKVRNAIKYENTFQARDERLRNDPNYAFEYASYLMNDCRKVKPALELLKKRFEMPLDKSLFTAEAIELYDKFTSVKENSFMENLFDKQEEIIAVYGKKEFNSWMQRKGNLFLANKYYEDPTNRDNILEELAYLDEHKCMKGKLYQVFSDNLDALTSGDFMDKYQILRKYMLKAKDFAFKSRLMSLLLNTTDKAEQKVYREELITLNLELAKREKDLKLKKRYSDTADKLENLDD